MEDPKSSVSDSTPWFDQDGTPTDPVVPPARPDRHRRGPDEVRPPASASDPGFLTDSEAFELLAVGMTDASDALASPDVAAEAITSETGPADDVHDPVIVRKPGKGSVGSRFPTNRVDPARTADTVEGAGADLDLSDVGVAAGEFRADCDELPPLVVIPDEQRNRRRNQMTRPVRGERVGGATPQGGVKPKGGPGSRATGPEPADTGADPADTGSESPADDGELVTLGQLRRPVEPDPVENAEADRATAARTTGDVDEIERIYENYAGPVVAVAATLLSDQTAINDTLYETFATAWRAASSFESVGPKGPWLFTLARRCAHDRTTSTEVSGESRASGIYPAPSHRGESVAGLDEAWHAWEVRLALEQLPLSDRNVLRLIHYQGMIDREIASELGIPVGTVKSRAYAGSRRLMELLDHVVRPQARHSADDDLASALTWYLSGLADGSELDGRQRQAVKRIQHQLASAPAWIQPAPAVRSRVYKLAAAESFASPAPARRSRSVSGTEADRHRIDSLGRTTVHYDMAEAEDLFYTRHRHELPVDAHSQESAVALGPRAGVLVPAAVAVVLFTLAWMGWRSMSGSGEEAVSGTGEAQTGLVTGQLEGDESSTDAGRSGAPVGEGRDPIDPGAEQGRVEDAAGVGQDWAGSPETILVYELMATDVDPGARALVLVSPTAGGAEYELQIQALQPTVGDQYLAAWLVNGDQWGRSGGSGGQAAGTDPTVQPVDPGGNEASVGDAGTPLAIPLGSFQWAQESGGFRFSSATVDDRFDTIVITRQRPADPIGPSGPVVFFGTLGS